jgi:hypothetical protein
VEALVEVELQMLPPRKEDRNDGDREAIVSEINLIALKSYL